MKKIALLLGLVIFTSTLFSQIKTYRKLPNDNSIGFGQSSKFNVEVKACNGSYQNVYTYGITPNDNQVTQKEHIAMFGFEPSGGPATIKITLQNGTSLSSSNIELINKTYKGVSTSFSGGAMYIEVCNPMKQLMVRMPGDKANPLMIHVDPYDDPAIPSGANVKIFDGGSNGKIHEQTANYDRYTVPNNIDVIVIEDGALFKGTIHTDDDRSTPLTIQGKGMIICREVSKPSNDVKMQYNALEINDSDGHKIYGVTVVNGRHFAIRVTDDAHVQNIKLYGYRNNNDGIVAGDDSKIENSFFKCNDDHIKLYSPRMEVRNCVFYEQSNGAIFQFAWNKLDPGDNCLIENIEVLEWEANCGDPEEGTGGIARSFINHRESEEAGKVCNNTTFRNIYIKGPISRFVCLNGWSFQSITYNNLNIENATLEQAPADVNWLYANKADNNSTSIEINFKNVRFGDRFIKASDFKTLGTVNLSFDNTGTKYTGMMNPSDPANCQCDGSGGDDLNDITDLSATASSCNSVVLNWTDNSTGEDGFRVRRKLSGESSYTTLTDVAANATSYTDNSVAENTSYIYQVRALDGSTAVTTSNTPQVTTPVCNTNEFVDISDLLATASSCNTVVLNWTDLSTGESGFRIRRKLAGASTFTTLTDIAANSESYTDNSVAENTAYVYQVRALDGGTAVTASNQPQVTTPACNVEPYDVDIFITHKSSGTRLYNDGNSVYVETTSGNSTNINATWRLVSIADDPGYYRLMHVGSNRYFHCMEDGVSRLELGPTSWTGERTRWTTVDADQGYVRLEHKASGGLWLHVKPDGVTNFALGPQTWTGNNTQWQLEIAPKSAKALTAINVNVYPNPVKDKLNIELFDASAATISIVNLSGHVIYRTEINNTFSTVDISELNSGMYIVQINTTNNTVTKHLLKE